MIGTSAIKNLIRENKIAQMYSSIQTGQNLGMQTLDQNLSDLVRRNVISPAEARSEGQDSRELPGVKRDGTRPGLEIRQRPAAPDGQAQRLDLFLTADFPPAIKVDGKVTKVSPQPLTGQHTLALARAVMNDKQAAEFERTKECNFAISAAGHRPLPRQRLHAAGPRRPGVPHHPADAADHRRPGPAQGAEGHGDDQARAGHLRRRHRLGQEHLAGGDGRLAQRALLRPHHHDRRPGGVRAPAQELHRHAARGGHRHRQAGKRR
jgi:hypothetical protein